MKNSTENKNIYQEISLIVVNLQALIGALGIVGNLLTYFVFQRKRLKNASYSLYYRTVAILNCLVLAHTFRHWIRIVFGFDLNLVSRFFCITNEYQPHVAGLSSLWLLTVVLFDRLVAVVYHNKLVVLKKRWFQYTVIAIVIIYSGIIHSIMPLKYRLDEVKLNASTTTSLRAVVVSRWICCVDPVVLQLNSFILFTNILLLMVINFVLYVKLLRYIFKRRKRIIMRTNPVLARDVKFAINSIALTSFELITKLPIGIGLFWFYYKYFHTEPHYFRMCYLLFVTIAILSHSFTFLVNMLFNSIFYEEFLAMIRRPKKSSVAFV